MLIESDDNGLIAKEKPLLAYKGRIKGKRIAIKNDMTTTEKACVLAEELGHHFTTVGDILDQSSIQNRKQELKARMWAYDKMVGLSGIINGFNEGCRSLTEFCEYLCVTDEFFKSSMLAYKEKYGICVKCDNYVIYFEPLVVLKIFDN